MKKKPLLDSEKSLHILAHSPFKVTRKATKKVTLQLTENQ